jgi:hypothetical protein
MKARILLMLLSFALACPKGSAAAREVVLPAGTLLTCMLDEPNFSSATTTIGDPFLCHPRTMQMFGQTVFPRGTYLVGHLEADKDPGHFWGKGYMKLSFDRIGLANTDLPLPAKIIAVKGYRVDRQGKIIGHGHAKRDTFEWLFPPLWPWKVLALPARGPRPALKGEVAVTLRIMEDVTVPVGNPFRGPFGDPNAGVVIPQQAVPAPATPSAVITQSVHPGELVIISPPSVGELATHAVSPHPPATDAPMATSLAAMAASVTTATPGQDLERWRRFGIPKIPGTTLIAMKQGTVYAVTQYRRDQDILAFVLINGALGTLNLRDVDWSTTTQLNSERGVKFTLHSSPICNGECAGF